MRVADFERLYDYSCWANARLFDVVSRIAPEQFTRNVAGSYQSVRNTLVHTLSAEWGWMERCGGPPRGAKLDPANYPTAASVITAWKQVEKDFRAFLMSMNDADLSKPVEFGFSPGEKKSQSRMDILQHAMNHASHHRGQVSLLLRELGVVPGNYDFLWYADERPANLHGGGA